MISPKDEIDPENAGMISERVGMIPTNTEMEEITFKVHLLFNFNVEVLKNGIRRFML
jgi:hypothetical protein